MLKYIALIAFLLLAAPALAQDSAGISTTYTSKVTGEVQKRLEVLFLGNSYTYTNNLPKMVADIASSDAGNRIQLDIKSATRAGGTLQSLWNDDYTRGAFAGGKWHFVVLQEHSLWAMRSEKVEETTEAARQWAQLMADESEARLVLFQTWPRQPGSFWYTDRKYSYLGNFRNMQKQIAVNTAALAVDIGAVLAPVGDAWGLALQENQKWPLYAADSHNPTVAGTYLSALVFYQTFTGRSAEDASFVPQGLEAESAAALRKFAASVRMK